MDTMKITAGNRHRHYEMIVAKAANMDLVVFVKCGVNDSWTEHESTLPDSEFSDVEYFLCLPQHKEACLHWLNGGEVQYRIEFYDWVDGSKNVSSSAWSIDNMFMLEQIEFRIKPKKVNKYIGIYEDYKTTHIHDSEDDVDTFMMLIGVERYKTVEIEVEE